jgi:CRISPR-associated protein Cas1
MKKLLNTLYITRQETYLHKERETIVVRQGVEKLGQFPVLTIQGIFCFGQVSVSPALMGFCGERGIGLAFYTEFGRFLARVVGKQTGNVYLRRTQYRWADDELKSSAIARVMIGSKIANSRTVIQREIRNHGASENLSKSSEGLGDCLRRCKQAIGVDSIRGIEGEAAAIYFGVFKDLLREDGFVFEGRIRRPPTDPVNALLSFVYSLATQECGAALQGIGLDPYVGFLHKDRSGRQSLALDLLEEFRAAWADRFVLTMINRKQIQLQDFEFEASGAVRLKDKSRKLLLVAWQSRKQEEILHPYLEERIPVGLLPHCQALLLARHLRGDTEYYPPWLVK